jgi:3-dehydroquinate synthase
MKTLKIKASTGTSKIYIGEKIENAHQYLPGENVVIITDENVKRLYHGSFPSNNILTIGMGEKIKTLTTVENLYGELLDMEADRSTFILGIGGGIVCDIAGFVASTYMRGLRFGFVSTTLLSQIDASVGGKNGVNFRGYKNIVGVFNQPEFVLCDLQMLKTLSEKQISCGFAEIIKQAAICDPNLLNFLETNRQQALSLENAVIEKIVYDSVVIKSAVVNKDDREKGERKKLNFGHTLGHAFEKYLHVSHGEAVAVGMVMATRISLEKGLIDHSELERLIRLIEKYNLPTKFHIDKNHLFDAIRKDKKRNLSHIEFILLHGLGKAVVEKFSFEEAQLLIEKTISR